MTPPTSIPPARMPFRDYASLDLNRNPSRVWPPWNCGASSHGYGLEQDRTLQALGLEALDALLEKYENTQ